LRLLGRPCGDPAFGSTPPAGKICGRLATQPSHDSTEYRQTFVQLPRRISVGIERRERGVTRHAMQRIAESGFVSVDRVESRKRVVSNSKQAALPSVHSNVWTRR
jgi:hypothetical protein